MSGAAGDADSAEAPKAEKERKGRGRGRGRRRSVRTQASKRRATARVPHEVKAKTEEHEREQVGGSAEQRHEKAAGTARAGRTGGNARSRGRRRAVRQSAPKKAVADNPKVAKRAEDCSPDRAASGKPAASGDVKVLRRGKKRAVRKTGASARARAPKAQDNDANKQSTGSGANHDKAKAKSGRGRRRVARRSKS